MTIALMVLSLALICLCAPTVGAQCPLCRIAIESSSQSIMMGRGLNLAILVLLVPPVTIFCSFFIVAYKRRKGSE